MIFCCLPACISRFGYVHCTHCTTAARISAFCLYLPFYTYTLPYCLLPEWVWIGSCTCLHTCFHFLLPPFHSPATYTCKRTLTPVSVLPFYIGSYVTLYGLFLPFFYLDLYRTTTCLLLLLHTYLPAISLPTHTLYFPTYTHTLSINFFGFYCSQEAVSRFRSLPAHHASSLLHSFLSYGSHRVQFFWDHAYALFSSTHLSTIRHHLPPHTPLPAGTTCIPALHYLHCSTAWEVSAAHCGSFGSFSTTMPTPAPTCSHLGLYYCTV